MFPRARSGGLLSAFVVWLVVSPPALAQPARARHTRVSLLSEADAVRPGQPLTVGIRLQMDEGWHTYWRNPGDSGLPTRARWELPAGFTAGEIQWPYPSRFASGPLVNYGYEGEVLLPVEIRVPASLPAPQVRIAARVDWLECQEACLPGRADLSLTIPVRATSAPTAERDLFADVRRRLPRKDPAWGFSVSSTARRVSLVVRPPRGTELREAYFYPALPRVLDHGRPQTLTREGTADLLALARDPNAAPLERLAGVLVAGTGSGPVAVAVDVPLVRGPARTSLNQEAGS